MPRHLILSNLALAAILAALARAGGEFVTAMVLESDGIQGNTTSIAAGSGCGVVERLPGGMFRDAQINCKEKTGGCSDEEDAKGDNKAVKKLRSDSADERFDQCAAWCCGEPLCYSFSIDSAHYCYLYKPGANYVPGQNAISGRLKEKKPSGSGSKCRKGMAMIAGYYFRAGPTTDLNCRRDMGMAKCPEGSDIYNQGMLSFRVSGSIQQRYDQCSTHCCQYKQCGAFSANNEVCYLKKADGWDQIPANGLVSGWRNVPRLQPGQCEGTTFAQLQQNIAFHWADLNCRDIDGGCDYARYPYLRRGWWAVFQVAGSLEQRFEQCSSYCCAQSKCASFSFSDTNCWLKRGTGFWRHGMWGVHSAFVNRPSPSPSASVTAKPSGSMSTTRTPLSTPTSSHSEGATPSTSPSSILESELKSAVSEYSAVIEAEKAVEAAEASYDTAKARYDRISRAIEDAAAGIEPTGGKKVPTNKQKLAALRVVEHRMRLVKNAKKLLEKIRSLASTSVHGASDAPVPRDESGGVHPSYAADQAKREALLSTPSASATATATRTAASAAPTHQQGQAPSHAAAKPGGSRADAQIRSAGALKNIRSWFGKLFRFGGLGSGSQEQQELSAEAEEWSNALSGLEGLQGAVAQEEQFDLALASHEQGQSQEQGQEQEAALGGELDEGSFLVDEQGGAFSESESENELEAGELMVDDEVVSDAHKALRAGTSSGQQKVLRP